MFCITSILSFFFRFQTQKIIPLDSIHEKRLHERQPYNFHFFLFDPILYWVQQMIVPYFSRSLFFHICLYSLTDMLLLVGTDISIRKHVFFSFMVVNHYIWFISHYFSVSLDKKKTLEYCSFLLFCNWFCLVFIPF